MLGKVLWSCDTAIDQRTNSEFFSWNKIVISYGTNYKFVYTYQFDLKLRYIVFILYSGSLYFILMDDFDSYLADANDSRRP